MCIRDRGSGADFNPNKCLWGTYTIKKEMHEEKAAEWWLKQNGIRFSWYDCMRRTRYSHPAWCWIAKWLAQKLPCGSEGRAPDLSHGHVMC